MTSASMTPGSRPRRGVIGVLALLGAGALTTALVLAAGEASDPPQVAGAVELATFASCDELADWGAEAMGTAGGGDEATSFDAVGAEIAPDGAAPVAREESNGAMTAGADDSGDSAEGGSETPTEGGGTVGEQGSAPPPATTMVPAPDDPGATVPAATDEPEADEPVTTAPTDEGDEDEEADEPADDETNVAVEGVDEIDLVDRLTEDVVLVASATRLAVVDLVAAEVIEATTVPWDAQITYDAEAGVAWAVGHPDEGGLSVERYAVDVEGLESEGRWTTTGSLVDARRVGDELHVVATEGFDMAFATEPAFAGEGPVGTVVEEEPVTTVAPDAAGVPFDDGPVACDEVLHPVGPSDPTATLLVTLPATGAVEPVRATEVVGSGSLVHVTTGAIYLATPQWGAESATTGIHRFDLATLEPTGSGSVDGMMLDEFSMSELDGVLRVAVTQQGFGTDGLRVEGDVAVDEAPLPAPSTTIPGEGGDDVVAPPQPTVVEEPGEALNEIVVLDTEGALDLVGRTAPFGHPGETLHGIRFAGTTAYAVTFLQTDPFYVVDLSDPSDPQVVGEVELPGFSSYLHPLGGGLVVGFGPGEDGRVAAKLFDVSDPAQPAVVGDLVLGDESAVTYDHHAYLDLGDGRFAVPATSYGQGVEPMPLPEDGVTTDEAFTATGLASSVVVVDTAGGELVEVARHDASTAESVTRILRVDDGWALLAGPEIVVLDAAGATTATIRL